MRRTNAFISGSPNALAVRPGKPPPKPATPATPSDASLEVDLRRTALQHDHASGLQGAGDRVALVGVEVVVAEHGDDRHRRLGQLAHQHLGLLDLADLGQVPGQQEGVGAGADLGQPRRQPAARVEADVDVTDRRDADRHRCSASGRGPLRAALEVGDHRGLGEELLGDGDRRLAALRRGQLAPQHHPLPFDPDLQRLVVDPGIVGECLVQAGHQVVGRVGHRQLQVDDTSAWSWLIAEVGTGTSTESE